MFVSIRKNYFFNAKEANARIFTGEQMAIAGGCFGGANGERGFINYFDAVLKDVGRLYILKGGCGCGKSTLMRTVANEAAARGETAEPIYCASDPNSLDGIVLRQRGVAVVDGTAPHERSPRCVGAVDCTVDLGEYLNAKKLRERADEITALTDKKGKCYKSAYGLLAAAGEIRVRIDELVSPAVLWGKLHGAARRIAARHTGKGGTAEVCLRPRTAFCGKGIVAVSDYGYEKPCVVHDPYGTAHYFYRALFAACIKERCAVTVSPDPQSPDRIESLRTDTDGTLFCTDTADHTDGVINMERFVDKELMRRTRARRRFLQKAYLGLTDAAKETLAEARELHGKLEDIYVPAVNFARIDKRTAALIKDIFA